MRKRPKPKQRRLTFQQMEDRILFAGMEDGESESTTDAEAEEQALIAQEGHAGVLDLFVPVSDTEASSSSDLLVPNGVSNYVELPDSVDARMGAVDESLQFSLFGNFAGSDNYSTYSTNGLLSRVRRTHDIYTVNANDAHGALGSAGQRVTGFTIRGQSAGSVVLLAPPALPVANPNIWTPIVVTAPANSPPANSPPANSPPGNSGALNSKLVETNGNLTALNETMPRTVLDESPNAVFELEVPDLDLAQLNAAEHAEPRAISSQTQQLGQLPEFHYSRSTEALGWSVHDEVAAATGERSRRNDGVAKVDTAAKSDGYVELVDRLMGEIAGAEPSNSSGLDPSYFDGPSPAAEATLVSSNQTVEMLLPESRVTSRWSDQMPEHSALVRGFHQLVHGKSAFKESSLALLVMMGTKPLTTHLWKRPRPRLGDAIDSLD